MERERENNVWLAAIVGEIKSLCSVADKFIQEFQNVKADAKQIWLDLSQYLSCDRPTNNETQPRNIQTLSDEHSIELKPISKFKEESFENRTVNMVPSGFPEISVELVQELKQEDEASESDDDSEETSSSMTDSEETFLNREEAEELKLWIGVASDLRLNGCYDLGAYIVKDIAESIPIIQHMDAFEKKDEESDCDSQDDEEQRDDFLGHKDKTCNTAGEKELHQVDFHDKIARACEILYEAEDYVYYLYKKDRVIYKLKNKRVRQHTSDGEESNYFSPNDDFEEEHEEEEDDEDEEEEEKKNGNMTTSYDIPCGLSLSEEDEEEEEKKNRNMTTSYDIPCGLSLSEEDEDEEGEEKKNRNMTTSYDIPCGVSLSEEDEDEEGEEKKNGNMTTSYDIPCGVSLSEDDEDEEEEEKKNENMTTSFDIPCGLSLSEDDEDEKEEEKKKENMTTSYDIPCGLSLPEDDEDEDGDEEEREEDEDVSSSDSSEEDDELFDIGYFIEKREDDSDAVSAEVAAGGNDAAEVEASVFSDWDWEFIDDE